MSVYVAVYKVYVYEYESCIYLTHEHTQRALKDHMLPGFGGDVRISVTLDHGWVMVDVDLVRRGV